ncbi:putative membrane protein [Brucella neotomae 5K33]|nr:putative membrane protein [Brucella neotomae 5K33]
MATLFAFVMFGISIVLSYRLTFVALQRPHTYAAPFFACVFIGSLFLTALLQQLLGISFDPHAY